MSIGGGNHTHHHGLLAGIGAGAMAVIVIPLLAIWLAKSLITAALGVVIWAAVIGGILFACRFLWHKHVQFSAAASPAVTAVVRAEVAGGTVRELAPAPVHPAAAVRGEVHLHLPEGMNPAEVAVLLAGLRTRHPELDPVAEVRNGVEDSE
jgi:hypothetical protein